MPIRLMMWNVENFGGDGTAYKNAKGSHSIRLASFIARLVKYKSVDILLVVEVKPTAKPSLDNLLRALNEVMPVNDWMYDYVKGAIKNKLEDAPVNHPDHLTWKTQGREEGCAVFWRNSCPEFKMLRAEFPMSEGAWWNKGYAVPLPVPEHVISLSRHGRVVEDYDPQHPTSNFRPDDDPWADTFGYSSYPRTSKLLDFKKLEYRNTRRPAYVLIRRKAGNGQPDRLIPLMVYHAPSYRSIATRATYVSGLARELYAVKNIDEYNQPTGPLIHPLRFVAGGDFNVEATDNDWNWYRSYFDPFDEVIDDEAYGGANGNPIYTNNNTIGTTIQLNEEKNGTFTGAPIQSDFDADYRFAAIDNMFQRAVNPTQFSVIDMLAEVKSGNPDIMAGMKVYSLALNTLNTRLGTNRFTGPRNDEGRPMFPFMTNWLAFLDEVKQGRFTTARSAAEFVHGFVSDHLPMLIEFT